MGPQAEGQTASRQGALLYFQNKEEATASRELRFSAPLDMGRMVLGLNQDTIFQPCICPGPGAPADKVLGLWVPPSGPPPSEQ